MDFFKIANDVTNVYRVGAGLEPIADEPIDYETPEEYRRQDAERRESIVSPSQPMRGGEL